MNKKTVVITGSARGLGYEMAKCFRKKNFNVVISDLNKKDIDKSVKELKNIKGKGDVLGIVCNITQDKDIINLIKKTKEKFSKIDFWVNNAGINQADKLIWNLERKEIDDMIDVDLKGTIIASKYIMEEMIKQNSGAIYTVEGHGSNDAVIPGLSIYGTAKRGVTYFVNALVNAYRDKTMELNDKFRKIYNILGDYPDAVAKFLVDKMIANTNNNVRINWLTNRKVIWKFLTYRFKKAKKI